MATLILFGTFDAERHPRITVLEQGLRQHGHDVVVVNEPVRDSTSERIEAARSLAAGVRWGAKVIGCWIRLLARSTKVRAPGAVIVGYMGVLDVILARLRWPRTVLVLDHMAPLAGIAADRHLSGSAARVMALIDRIAERVATLVLFDTPDQAEHSSCVPAKRLVVPVGAPDSWYSPETSGGDDAFSLSVVFYGMYTPLQGAPTIGRAIEILSEGEYRFTMVGSGQELQATKDAVGERQSVAWIDWVSGTELPVLVASHDVCLGIFGTSEKARSVVPNKVFQGAAAGCAIVTADTRIQRDLLGDGATYVPAGDPEALADALRSLAKEPDLLRAAKRNAVLAAKAWTPRAVTRELADRLEREIALRSHS